MNDRPKKQNGRSGDRPFSQKSTRLRNQRLIFFVLGAIDTKIFIVRSLGVDIPQVVWNIYCYKCFP
ncbi:hypothetical protein QUB70_32320 [Microcoleus sp. A003_D6]